MRAPSVNAAAKQTGITPTGAQRSASNLHGCSLECAGAMGIGVSRESCLMRITGSLALIGLCMECLRDGTTGRFGPTDTGGMARGRAMWCERNYDSRSVGTQLKQRVLST